MASWLALRGRCRHCGQRVSPRYVIVEALVAALFAAVVARYGLSVQTAAYLVLVCILMAVALVDLDTFIIPNGFVVAGCVLWLVSIWFMPAPRVDAFSVDRSILNGYVDDSTMLLDAQFAPQEYGVATKKSNTELADQVDAAIGAMADDGTLTALQERWGLSTETPAGEEEGGGAHA